jgi:hypothetical protein
MPKIRIKDLKTKSDAELLELLGYTNKLAEFKTNIAEADKLTGKARELVEQRVQDMMTPNVYPTEIKWAIEDATRKSKGGKEALADDSPDSVMD